MKLLIFVLCVTLGVNASPLVEEEFSPFLINGVRANVAPYFAFIEYFNAQLLGFFGGGTLISNRHILTAATNVQGFTSFTVRLGSANRTAMSTHPVMPNPTVHPNYVAASRANDIAIMRLVTPIVPRADIHPILLPPHPTTPALILPSENEEGLFAGFGFQTVASTGPSAFLYRGFQRVTSNARCIGFFIFDTVQGFCAEDTVERSSGCNGDVGNPFVLSYRRQDVLVGILSMHPPCGQMSPTAYTRITFYRQWIAEQLLI